MRLALRPLCYVFGHDWFSVFLHGYYDSVGQACRRCGKRWLRLWPVLAHQQGLTEEYAIYRQRTAAAPPPHPTTREGSAEK